MHRHKGETLIDKHGCSGPMLAVFAGLWVLVVVVGAISVLSGPQDTTAPQTPVSQEAGQ